MDTLSSLDFSLTEETITQHRKYLEYIAVYWDQVAVHNLETKKRNGGVWGLPRPFVTPNMDKYDHLFYWDSYFHILGLLISNRAYLAKGTVENLIHLHEEFGMIPNFSKSRATHSRSQPPFLTSMLYLLYDRIQDKAWLEKTIAVAEQEYWYYWLGQDRLTVLHSFDEDNKPLGLSRYSDGSSEHGSDHLPFIAHLESGWDFSPRFIRRGYDRTMDFCPVDLNSLLGIYEQHFADFAALQGDVKREAYWKKRLDVRRELLHTFCYDEERGFWFDYDFVEKKKNPFYSLAGFFPLFANLVTKDAATRALDNLSTFLYTGGLVTTQPYDPLWLWLPYEERCTQESFHKLQALHSELAQLGVNLKEQQLEPQWTYPNVWPPVQWVVVKGFLNYGFHDQAKEIAWKYVQTCERFFNEQHNFIEKYNGEDPLLPPREGLYPNQKGFSWSIGVYLQCLKVLEG